MKISIVTPSYNQEEFIERTIVSVISQAGDFEIEYIIMDGGSTDRSIDIVKEYAERVKNKEYPLQCKGIELIWKSEKDK